MVTVRASLAVDIERGSRVGDPKTKVVHDATTTTATAKSELGMEYCMPHRSPNAMIGTGQVFNLPDG